MRKLIVTAALVASLVGCSSDTESEYGTVTDLAAAVCDEGTVQESRDGYDYPCKVDGQDILITDWSTFGSAPEEGPGRMSVNEVFGIQGPPDALATVQERLG